MPSGSARTTDPARGGLLARNTFFNLIGQGLPILVAIFAIPLLIGMLGTERFGVLTIAWIVMGYFGLFDLGLGRATTKFVAEYNARGETESLPELVWSSVIVNVGLGLLGGGILALLTPWIAQGILKVPADLTTETTVSFYLLAASVPAVVVTAALRGVLEAFQRFDLVNAVKVPASMINYIGPLLVLPFVDSLSAVVAFLVVSRLVVLLAHLVLCLRVMPSLSGNFGFAPARIKPLLGFGGWITVSNLVSPSIVTLDRFVVGAVISLSAVAFYATPYEVVTKLWIFSSSLLMVLFPAFTTLATQDERAVRGLYTRAVKYLLAIVAPVVGVLLALAPDLLTLWVGADFARNSAPVAQWLAVGVLVNILAQVPYTLLQSTGRADLPAKIQLVQLPLYALAVWYVAGAVGIAGVAAVWAVRAALEAAVFFVLVDKMLPSEEQDARGRSPLLGILVSAVFLLVFLAVGSVLSVGLVLKVVVVVLILGLFVAWEWSYFLTPSERGSLTGGLRGISKKFG